MKIPVIFTRTFTPQGGHFPGLPIALKCASKWNSRVILIGDSEQPASVRELAEFQPMEKFHLTKKELERNWPFGHLGDSWFLFQSLANWLPVFEFCLNQHIQFAAVFDADVLVFSDMTIAAEPWLDCHYAACNPCGTPQGPTLVSLDALEGFTKFLLEMYRGVSKVPPECYEESKCSMSAWRWYHALNPGVKVGNLCDIVNGVTWSHNAGMNYHGYEWNGTEQVFEFERGQPYSRTKMFGEERRVRFVNLHCWSHLKACMGDYLKRSEESMA